MNRSRVLVRLLPLITHQKIGRFMSIGYFPLSMKSQIFKRQYSTILDSKCSGCGAFFQKEFPNQPGYLPPLEARIETTPEEIKEIEASKEPLTPRQVKILLQKSKVIVCKRCHSFKSGAQRSVSLKTNRIQFRELKQKQGGLVIMVLDLVDLPGSMIHDITEYVGSKNVVILLNKADLMPRTMDMARVIQYVGAQPFAKNSVDIIPMSAKTGQGLATLASHLITVFKKREDCYLVGCTSAGKSTILNQLKVLVGEEKLATTSRQSGTTVGVLRMSSRKLVPALEKLVKQDIVGTDALQEDVSVPEQGTEQGTTNTEQDTPTSVEQKEPENYLYDTAGIVHDHQIANLFGEKELSYFSPAHRIIPRKENRRVNEVLYLGGFCRIEIIHAVGPVEFWIYGSNKLKIHKGRKAKIEYLDSQIGKNAQMLYPPIDSKRTIPFPALKKAGVYKNGSRPCMYYVSGAGWFTINGMCHIRISTPNGVGISAVKVDFCQ